MPPALTYVIQGRKGVRWHGDYASWKEARSFSQGYDNSVILEKVKKASLKVKAGEAAFERDSVLFHDIQYSWPLLAGLMWICAQSMGKLSVIDFGGALGSTYFQNKTFFKSLSRVRWNIVEQKHFVDTGKRYFEDNELRFYDDIESCLKKNSPNVIIFSSVIQYMENPYRFLKSIRSIGFEFIFFDRTFFVTDTEDRLTVQVVPPQIYPGSYPCWFFNKENFYSFFYDDYEVIAEFDALAGKIKIDRKQSAFDKGILFRQRK
jgi:putative methyltransferase (TIGR04325 family)